MPQSEDEKEVIFLRIWLSKEKNKIMLEKYFIVYSIILYLLFIKFNFLQWRILVLKLDILLWEKQVF